MVETITITLVTLNSSDWAFYNQGATSACWLSLPGIPEVKWASNYAVHTIWLCCFYSEKTAIFYLCGDTVA